MANTRGKLAKTPPRPMEAVERTMVVYSGHFPDLRFGRQTRSADQDGETLQAGVMAMTPLK